MEASIPRGILTRILGIVRTGERAIVSRMRDGRWLVATERGRKCQAAAARRAKPWLKRRRATPKLPFRTVDLGGHVDADRDLTYGDREE